MKEENTLNEDGLTEEIINNVLKWDRLRTKVFILKGYLLGIITMAIIQYISK